ncbi:MAG: glycosyltransferase family 4 protein [Thermoleophilia bacterium]
MKITLISAEFPPLVGGVASFAAGLASGLVDNGVIVEVITVAGEESAAIAYPVHRMGPKLLGSRYWKLGPLAIGTHRVASKCNADLMVAMVWTHDGLVARALAALSGTPYVVFANGSEILSAKAGSFRHMLMMNVYRSAECVFAISYYTRNLLLSLGIAKERVCILNPPVIPRQHLIEPNWVDDQFKLEGKIVLLTASRLVPRKGHQQVLEAMSRLRLEYPNLCYVITGEGARRKQLEALAAQLKLTERVRFVGFVSPSIIQALYSRCDIYVSPSLEVESDVEGFGIALCEASLSRKPVIAGKSGGVRDSVQDGETGLLVEPGNVGQLTETLARLIKDENLRRQLGEAGFLRASQFTPQRQARAFIDMITNQSVI